MKFALLFATALYAQDPASIWRHASEHADRAPAERVPEFRKPNLSEAQRESLVALLESRKRQDAPGCLRDEWLKNLLYETIPLSANAETIVIEAGAGCARGAQGSNGAMWLVQFRGAVPPRSGRRMEN